MTEPEREWLTARFDRLEDRLERIESRFEVRLRSLETWKALLIGAGAVLASLASVVGWLLGR